MEIAPRISVDEKVCFGKPVITGTRVPVDLILGKLAGGMSYEEVAKEYEITHEDILAALDYAARAISGKAIRPARFPRIVPKIKKEKIALPYKKSVEFAKRLAESTKDITKAVAKAFKKRKR
jgi:uncharacterized protein (DUF433 family)